MKRYKVADCDFNRANYRGLIGRVYSTPPGYAAVEVVDYNEVYYPFAGMSPDYTVVLVYAEDWQAAQDIMIGRGETYAAFYALYNSGAYASLDDAIKFNPAWADYLKVA